jgi:serine/threonine protein kinase
LAYHLKEKKYYAMKIINIKKMKRTLTSRNTTGIDSLEQEIEIMKKIQTKYWCKLHEVITDEEDDQAYLAVEYVNGGSLEHWRKHTQLTPENIRHFFRQLILGVECLHSVDIIHRDIKPENILIDKENNLKITDFGISQLLKNGDDTWTNTAGTNYFFCPESCKGEAYNGKKADIWACGVTLYLLLFNKYPFNGKTHVELNNEIIKEDPMSEIYCDQSLAALLKGILDKNPDTRFTIKDIKTNSWVTADGKEPLQNDE